MSPEYRVEILEQLYTKDFLYEIGTRNNIKWNTGETDEETWRNFKTALIGFLGEKELDLDFTEESDIQAIIESYSQLREIHKKYMVPHIRGVMNKIKEESGDTVPSSEELLEDAYEMLSLHGGAQWNDKLNTLHYYSQRIRELSELIEEE